ncbi:hypothetical protein IEO21_07862 [Rhodonia placenta]|uniref:ferric-chelate reductase (NADPH) n=1 Tax=Rhodonia placenta TaxID=104341 RepID=A0A8H7NXC7_9APHY|nr:hypothetical protein IEO21_07862 [Postia placenta]
MSDATQSSAAHPTSSSQSTRPGEPTGQGSEMVLLFHIDLLLLCLLAICILLAVPRMLVHLSHKSEWSEGIFLRRYAGDPARQQESPAQNRSSIFFDRSRSNQITSQDTSQAESIEVHPMRNYSRQTLLIQAQHPPKHVPTLSTVFPGVSRLLSFTVRPGYTVGKLVLILAYLGLMLYGGLYGSNPFTNPARAGLVATSQIPLVIMVATKNNVLTYLLGLGYEKASALTQCINWIHRFVGRFIIFAVNCHALGFRTWNEATTLPPIRLGLLALTCMDILFLLSISTLRQICYPVFYASHVVAAIVMLAAVYKHVPENYGWQYAVTGMVLYAVDRCWRILQTRVAMANLQLMPELRVVRLSIPRINGGWRAGQHVRIKVLSTGMGLIGWAEPHPFTIASVSKVEGDGLVLMCKKAGDWTNKLYGLAQHTSDGKVILPLWIVEARLCTGGPGHAMVTSYSAAMLVAGGSGVTYMLSTVSELLRKATEGACGVKFIELVWSVQDPALFTTLLDRAESLWDILESVVNRTLEQPDNKSLDKLTGVMVGVCGPLALGEEVANTVRAFPRDKFKSVGGIEVHEE